MTAPSAGGYLQLGTNRIVGMDESICDGAT
jgi:hypothetical protein